MIIHCSEIVLVHISSLIVRPHSRSNYLDRHDYRGGQPVTSLCSQGDAMARGGV